MSKSLSQGEKVNRFIKLMDKAEVTDSAVTLADYVLLLSLRGNCSAVYLGFQGFIKTEVRCPKTQRFSVWEGLHASFMLCWHRARNESDYQIRVTRPVTETRYE